MTHMAILCLLVTTIVNASEITSTQILDHSVGLDAIVVTIPAALNGGFSIIDTPSRSPGSNIRDHWDPEQNVVMVNGGYFEHDFSPTGLCRIDGKLIGKTKSEKLSGFIAIDKKGVLSLLTRSDNLAKYPTVLQAGPYVIDPGGMIGIRSRSGPSARRTLVGKCDDGAIVVVVTKHIGLFDLAVSIKKHIPTLDRLLNLDGGPSTALVSPEYEIINKWPVRNYLLKTKSASDDFQNRPTPLGASHERDD